MYRIVGTFRWQDSCIDFGGGPFVTKLKSQYDIFVAQLRVGDMYSTRSVHVVPVRALLPFDYRPFSTKF